MGEKTDIINRKKSSAALLSITSNTVLVVLKLSIGLVIGSVSVMSEAIHSSMDLLAALIAFFAVKTAGKAADPEHPFGHGKFENISGTIEAILIFLAAGLIIYEAVKKLLNPEPMEEAWLGVAVMLISCITNIFVSRRLFRVGEETDSVALKADAWHLRTDVYTSAGVLGALAIIWLGNLVHPGLNLYWLDPVAAIGVALLIIKAAYKLTVESARDLLDASLPGDEESGIKKSIAAFSPFVRGFHKLSTRKSGSQRFVEFHLKVDPLLSIDESHRIAEMVSCSIKQQYPGTAVNIHLEPCKCSHELESTCDCFVT